MTHDEKIDLWADLVLAFLVFWFCGPVLVAWINAQ
jgi:hypothetical protein